jgi:hypothetical protein
MWLWYGNNIIAFSSQGLGLNHLIIRTSTYPSIPGFRRFLLRDFGSKCVDLPPERCRQSARVRTSLSTFGESTSGLFGLAQQFPNIENVYFYIQRGCEDSQILTVGIC